MKTLRDMCEGLLAGQGATIKTGNEIDKIYKTIKSEFAKCKKEFKNFLVNTDKYRVWETNHWDYVFSYPAEKLLSYFDFDDYKYKGIIKNFTGIKIVIASAFGNYWCGVLIQDAKDPKFKSGTDLGFRYMRINNSDGREYGTPYITDLLKMIEKQVFKDADTFIEFLQQSGIKTKI